MKIVIEYDTKRESALLKANGHPLVGTIDPVDLRRISPWAADRVEEIEQQTGEKLTEVYGG